MYATSLVMILGTPVLAVTILLLAAERLLGVGIFDPALGGDPILFQHLFWFYSHPAVYIMILPSFAVINEVIPCFSRRPIFGYSAMAGAILTISVLSFLVWGHHMFVSGQAMYAGMIFSILSFLVGVPTGIKVFNWTATMYKGRVRFDTPMLYALGFVGLFVVGGLTGLILASLGVDVHVHDTYFRRRALPLHHGGRGGHGLHGGPPLLVAQDQRQDVPGDVGEAGGADDLHRVQPDLLPAVRARLPGDAPALLRVRLRIPGAERDVVAGASILAVGYLLPLAYLILSLWYSPDAGPEPLGGHRPGVADVVAAPQAQLRRDPGRDRRPLSYAGDEVDHE
jgi:cytochrome c oxidase subunit 1